ncbi:dihydrofolate reductase family protein [Polaromonas sp. UC242_47]|uniref:dihydrofolate reductase family protein n=1 Tax=Polaromonas sp. UC242_47 TaxID=3374626 RepID=UPI0037A92848
MKTSVYIASSVDGFIARSNGELDWLPMEKDVDGGDFGYQAFMDSVDTIVMGRHTYEKVLSFGEWPFDNKRVVVLSTAAPDIPASLVGRLQWLSGTPQEVLTQLAAQGAEHAYIDGGKTIQAFLQAGLIQRLIVTRIPVLLGQGIPLFGPLAGDVPLQHCRTMTFQNGMVQSEYSL